MRRTITTVGGLVLLTAAGCGRPAQIGPDEEAHKAVDALFTALTARDVKLLDQSERRLGELRATGKLPEDAHAAVQKVIAKARGGKWEAAAERLYDFIRGQQTGPAQEPKPARKTRSAARGLSPPAARG